MLHKRRTALEKGRAVKNSGDAGRLLISHEPCRRKRCFCCKELEEHPHKDAAAPAQDTSPSARPAAPHRHGLTALETEFIEDIHDKPEYRTSPAPSGRAMLQEQQWRHEGQDGKRPTSSSWTLYSRGMTGTHGGSVCAPTYSFPWEYSAAWQALPSACCSLLL